MKALAIALLVSLAMQSCLIPSMAAKTHTNDVATVSCSLGAMLSVMDTNVEALIGGRRRRRFWNEVERRYDNKK